MQSTNITEIVRFELSETAVEDKLFEKACLLNEFLRKQDGYINGELAKQQDENVWCFIYHFDCLESVRIIGQKMRAEKIFDEITPLLTPGSLSVTLYQQLMYM